MNDVKRTTPTPGTSAARRELHRQELRRSILEAAGGLFLTQGYDGISMRRIADQIGYTPTTIYLHFKNKDELLLALLDEGYARLGAALAEAAGRERDALRRLAAIGRAYVAFGLANPMHYQLMFMRRADFMQAALATSREGQVNSFDVLRAATQAALDAGAIRPADPMVHSLALWAQVHGIVALAVMMPAFDDVLIERVSDLSLNAFLEGLKTHA